MVRWFSPIPIVEKAAKYNLLAVCMCLPASPPIFFIVSHPQKVDRTGFPQFPHFSKPSEVSEAVGDTTHPRSYENLRRTSTATISTDADSRHVFFMLSLKHIRLSPLTEEVRKLVRATCAMQSLKLRMNHRAANQKDSKEMTVFGYSIGVGSSERLLLP